MLTKSDAVDAETLDVVRMEVEEFLLGSFLEGQPIVAVSSLTGAGLEELKRAMIDAAAEVQPRPEGMGLLMFVPQQKANPATSPRGN